MKKYRKVLTTIFLVAIIIGANILNVEAGSVSLSFKGEDTVRVGENITLTIEACDISGLTNGLATAQGDLIFDDSYLEYVSFKSISSKLSVSYGTKTKRFVALGLGGEYIQNSDDLFTLTFRAKQIGTTTLNIKDVVIGDTKAIIHSSNIKEKQVNIIEAENNSPQTTNKTATTTNKKKKLPVTGNKNESISTDNALKSLYIDNAKMSPSFSKDTLSYNVVVKEEVTKLDLKYMTNDDKAKVKIEGNSNIKENSIVKIIVTAEDGSSRTYTLKVTKSDNNSSNRLILLNVKEGSLKEKFDSDKYEYSITVPKKTSKLTIDAIPEQKDAKVEIIGNRNLGKGTSTILIKLTDKNGYNSYYRLNVKKSSTVSLFGIDVRYLIIILVIVFILFWLLLLLLGKRKKEEEEETPIVVKKEEEDDPLFDDVVTKDEIIEAIEKKDPKLLKMLLTQEEANRLKDEIRNKETSDPYDEVVTKREIIEAIEKRDTKKLKMLLTQEEANRLKEELKDRDSEE